MGAANGLAYLIVFIVVIIGVVLIIVSLSRWVFRINDIVMNLEQINAKLSVLPGADKKLEPVIINPGAACSGCGYRPLKAITKADGTRGAECPSCRIFYPVK